MSVNQTVVFGIDVSKNKLDVASRPDQVETVVSNDTSGIETLIEIVSGYDDPLVIVESTGGLERRCAEGLMKVGIDVAVINPRQARDFAKACGYLEKTDSIDARSLAYFGQALEIESDEPVDEERKRLKELVRFRDDLVEEQTRLKNRTERQRYPDLSEILEDKIDQLDDEIDEVEAKIDELLALSTELAEDIDRLQSVPGVGEVVSRSLLANLPELGSINRKKVAKLAGVAPLNNDSGQKRGARQTRGGRPQVRSKLYMAVMNAKECCKPIQTFFDRLVEDGKPKQVAMVACMRKLLTILNSMMRHQTPFAPEKAMPK